MSRLWRLAWIVFDVRYHKLLKRRGTGGKWGTVEVWTSLYRSSFPLLLSLLLYSLIQPCQLRCCRLVQQIDISRKIKPTLRS